MKNIQHEAAPLFVNAGLNVCREELLITLRYPLLYKIFEKRQGEVSVLTLSYTVGVLPGGKRFAFAPR